MQEIDSNSFYISFSTLASPVSGAQFAMGYLKVARHGNRLVTDEFYDVVSVPGLDRGTNEKNWVTFLYRGELLFIPSINPLRVVKPVIKFDMERRQNVSVVIDVSLAGDGDPFPTLYNIKEWGWLRGGTNAILLDARHGVTPSRYLAFFHSTSKIGYSPRKTYFFGAYTFTDVPPFTLMTMSPYPLIDPRLYDGEWFPFRTPADYVPYPTTIFMNDTLTVHLVMGHNDNLGYTYDINLQKLLASMDVLMPASAAN
jgi:hypothetical protein